MKLTRNASRTIVSAVTLAVTLLLLVLVSGQAQPVAASLQPSAPEMPASDRNDAPLRQTPVPVLTPTGWGVDMGMRGTFHYTWVGMAGHQYWDGDGNGFQLTRAWTEFSFANIPENSIIQVCSRGNLPSMDYYEYVPSRVHAQPGSQWGTDFTVGGWLCTEQTLAGLGGGVLRIGHFVGGAEGRYQPDSYTAPPAHYNWEVWVKSINGYEFAMPPTLPYTSTLSGDNPKNGVGGLDGVSDKRECPVTGCNGAQGTAGDPINTLTGGFDLSVADLSISTLAGPLVFQRSYASLATGMYTAPLGYGWAHNQDTRLIFESGQVQFKAHSANQYRFTDNGDGTYTPFAGVLASLTRNPGPPVTYVLTNSAQAMYTFDAAGQLLTWADSLGHTFTYTYTAGRLSRVADSTGQRYLDLAYNPQGQLASVNDPTNRRVSYGYNAAGDLITATNVLSQSWRYTYDAAHRLTGIIDPNNVTILQTDYDAQGRAYRQYDGLNNKTVELAYTPSLSTTTLTDGLGRVVTHTYNSRNLLVSSEDAVGRTARAYDSNFRPAYVLDAKDNVTQQTWSADGANLVQVTDAASNHTSMEYDERNHLTRLTDARSNATRYGYVGNLLLITTTDALNGIVVNTYNPQNLLIRTVDHGMTTTFGYDGLGQRVAMSDTLGNVTRYEYDSVGRLITTTNPARQVTVNQYDKADRLIRVTANYTTAGGQNYLDEYNLVTQYGYDVAGRQVAITDTMGRITRNGYDNAGRLISTTVNYTTTSSQQNYLGQYNLITRYGYDVVGNQILVTDTLTRVTKTEYDAINRPVTVTVNYKDGIYTPASPDEDLQTITVYDAVGNVTARRDATGIWTTFAYDALGRLLAQSDVFSNTTRYGYDAVGSRVVMTDANGVITRYGYDALWRLTAVTESFTTTAGLNPNAYNVVTRYGYDSVGNRTVITSAKGFTTTFTYDALNRLASERDPLGNTSRYQYDAVGNRVVMTDANNTVTQYAYDSLNRLRVITYTADATTVKYNYDVVGNRLAMTDSTGVTTYAYDALNRPLTIASPLTGTVGYRYDAVGNRTQLIYPGGQVVTNTYDNANRLSSIIDWAGKTTRYAYDAAGRPLTTTLPNAITTTYRYDNAGRLINLSHKGQSLLATYTYTLDAVGNRVVVTETQAPGSGGGLASAWPQAPSMALASARSGDSSSAPRESSRTTLPRPLPVSSDPSLLLLAPLTALVVLGRRIKERRWYGILTVALLTVTLVGIGAYYFTEANASSNAQSGSGPMSFSSVASGAMTTNGSRGSVRPFVGAYYSGGSLYGGSVTAFTRGGFPATQALTGTTTIRYTYDPLYRLTGANYSGAHAYTFAYAYDAVGNRTSATQTITSTLVTAYSYDAANRLTSVNGVPYTWDNNGNLTNDGSKTYLYNQANQLITITATGLTWNAAYNGDGARLRQVTNGTPTTYTLDLAAPLVTALTERTGATTKQYVYGQGDSPMAVYTGTLSGAEGWTYLSGRDGLNSVRQETDASGNVLTTRGFDPYGVPLQGGGGQSFGYTGEQTDATGLVFLRARYMQPGLGIFLSRDPWAGTADRPVTIQGYNYTANNPIIFRDPAGTDYVLEIDRYTCNDSHANGGYVYQWNRAYGRWDMLACWVNTAGYTVIPEGSPFYPDPTKGPFSEPPPIPGPVVPPPPQPTPQPPVAPPHSKFDTSGYIEGWSASVVALASIRFIEGEEVVYDFATMQRARFHYTGYPDPSGGTGFCPTSLVNGSTSPYVGAVMGFKPQPKNSIMDYEGVFVAGQVGVGVSVGIQLGGGVMGFSSVIPGTTQPNFEIFGVDAYADYGKGIGFPVTEATIVTNYTMVRGSREDYNGNIHKMARDIFDGKDSPTSPSIPFRVWAAQQALAWWGE